MASLAATGAGVFLGWHTRVRAHVQGAGQVTAVRLGADTGIDAVAEAISGADRLLHLAGVNRGTAQDPRAGNTALARQLAAGLRQAATPPATLVYANSTQADNGTDYGTAKMAAAEILAAAAADTGAEFIGRPQAVSASAASLSAFSSTSAGVLNPSVFRGLRFSFAAISSSSV